MENNYVYLYRKIIFRLENGYEFFDNPSALFEESTILISDEDKDNTTKRFDKWWNTITTELRDIIDESDVVSKINSYSYKIIEGEIELNIIADIKLNWEVEIAETITEYLESKYPGESLYSIGSGNIDEYIYFEILPKR